jgi:hypothetical protein
MFTQTLIEFFDSDMLQLVELERLLLDHFNPSEREALWSEMKKSRSRFYARTRL